MEKADWALFVSFGSFVVSVLALLPNYAKWRKDYHNTEAYCKKQILKRPYDLVLVPSKKYEDYPSGEMVDVIMEDPNVNRYVSQIGRIDMNGKVYFGINLKSDAEPYFDLNIGELTILSSKYFCNGYRTKQGSKHLNDAVLRGKNMVDKRKKG